jgi:hypothetical protein
MNIFAIASASLAIALYFPLCFKILRGDVRQNFATWALWTLLDVVVAGTLMVQHGSYSLAVAYTLGGAITVSCILVARGGALWTKFESFVASLVIICVILWSLSGPMIGTIASTLAMVIAGIPQLIETYRNPWSSPFGIYAGYFFANVLAAIGAKSWAIEERFYPCMAAAFCLLIALFAARRFSARRTEVPA